MSKDGKGGSTIAYYSRTNGDTPMPQAGEEASPKTVLFCHFYCVYLLFTLFSTHCSPTVSVPLC